jgi:hypothetical protein
VSSKRDAPSPNGPLCHWKRRAIRFRNPRSQLTAYCLLFFCHCEEALPSEAREGPTRQSVADSLTADSHGQDGRRGLFRSRPPSITIRRTGGPTVAMGRTGNGGRLPDGAPVHCSLFTAVLTLPAVLRLQVWPVGCPAWVPGGLRPWRSSRRPASPGHSGTGGGRRHRAAAPAG